MTDISPGKSEIGNLWWAEMAGDCFQSKNHNDTKSVQCQFLVRILVAIVLH